MMQLRMKPEYIEWTKSGLKTATTRLKLHPHEEYELISGSRYKPIKSGVKIRVKNILAWTLASIDKETALEIVKAENFKDLQELIQVLEELNKDKLPNGISENQVLHTHFYEVIKK